MGGGVVRVEDYGGLVRSCENICQQKVKLACFKPEALDVMKLSHNPKCRTKKRCREILSKLQ